ncbi:MAG: WbuC family cupin fold metalloprotein [Bacteroidales bacterium]|nr:WbuC family cupin fold metalloprotein [Bacteroidales bacterium]
MIFNSDLFDSLLRQAQQSERKRASLDLRNTPSDNSQRLLNALMPGTQVPIHRHTTTTETTVILQGSIEYLFYNDRGDITERHTLTPSTPICGIHIPAAQWHTVHVLAPTIIFESKDGPYAPLLPSDILSL